MQGDVALSSGAWTVVGGAINGTITSNGTYVAPTVMPSPNSITLTYVAGAQQAQTSVSLLNAIPVLQSISPTAISTSTTVRLTGQGFTPDSAVIVNAKVMSSSYIDSTHLAVDLTPEVPNSGRLLVSVRNPDPGSSTSLPLLITTLPVSLTDVRIVDVPQIVRSNAPQQFRAIGDYSDGSTADITSSLAWSGTSDVARISTSGQAFCNNPGTARIVAAVGTQTTSATFACVLSRVAPFVGFSNTVEQFDGPFSSWTNIQIAFGAKGDGITDDSAAFQAAFDSLATPAATLWIPHGTYLISKTLHIVSTFNFSIIGEDPRNTILKWQGASGGTMLSLDGSSAFQIERLAWDGSGSAGVGINIDSTLTNGQGYPTHDAIEDSMIRNVGIGIQLGLAGETTVSRVHFDRNTNAGISLETFNTLNLNVIDSLFTDCNKGVTNYPGAGTYTVSNSVFLRSTTADLMMGNTGPFSIRQNLSVGSQAFFLTVDASNGANINMQGNTVLDTVGIPLQIGNPGPLMLVDNLFSDPDRSKPVLQSISDPPLDFFTLGNQFVSLDPYQGIFTARMNYDEAPISAASTSNIVVPTEIYIPGPSGRRSVDIPPGATSNQIQAVVNEASLYPEGGTVHFPAGSYNIDKSIIVPEKSNLTIIGDGLDTYLKGSQILSGPVISASDSVRLKDFMVFSSNDAAVELNIADSPSTRFFCDLCKTFDSQRGIAVEGIDHAAITFRSLINDARNVALAVSGGATRLAGLASLGRVDAFMATGDLYTVGAYGHLLIEDGWRDGGQGPSQFSLVDGGVVTQQGGAVMTGPAGMRVTGYKGDVNVLGLMTGAVLTIDSSSQAHATIMGILQTVGELPIDDQEAVPNDLDLFNFSTVNNQAPLLFTSGTSATTISPAAIEHAFGQTRTEYVTARTGEAPGTSEITLRRVDMASGTLGLHIQPKLATAVTGTYVITAPSGTPGTGSCQIGSVSLSGLWSLQPGNDGFSGLQSKGGFLSNTPSTNGGGDSLGMTSSMADAGQRWNFQPAGDGLFQIINRADGFMLTRDASGCAAVAPEVQGATSQEWLINGG